MHQLNQEQPGFETMTLKRARFPHPYYKLEVPAIAKTDDHTTVIDYPGGGQNLGIQLHR